MKNFFESLVLSALLALSWVSTASAQQANMYCLVDNGPPIHWAPCSASTPLISGGQPYNYTPLTPMQAGLAVTTSTALTIPIGALQAVVSVEGNSVRYTYDGTTAPTASVGHLLTSGQFIQFSGATTLANLRFIQTAATATLTVSYTK